MAKIAVKHVCQACGYEAPRWLGKCPECDGFSTFAEERVATVARGARGHTATHAPGSVGSPQPLSAQSAVMPPRMHTGIGEFDRVLGGGVVPGSLILIGGDPGIGKSTLLLEAAVRLAGAQGSGLYLSGEESVEQMRLRAERLGLKSEALWLGAETDLAVIEEHIRQSRPAFAVVDSIQTVAHPGLDGAPGTLTQIREGATTLQRVAKQLGVAIFIVGHVNKEGNLAGPRALEHIVDAVLQLEGDEHGHLRILRATKNRFGSTNELGVFEMTERGMEGVENPSQLFLSERQRDASGSVVVATVEGARPLLVEVQALCAPSYFTAPRRTVTGADFNRVNVILAVIEKRLGMRLGDMDVYVNVAGGVRVTEPAVDLGIALAVISSLRDVPLPPDACAFGEIGLAGEVRAVGHAERRVAEGSRLGYARCALPRSGSQRLTTVDKNVRLHPVASLHAAVEALLPGAFRESPGARRGKKVESTERGAAPRTGGAFSPDAYRSRQAPAAGEELFETGDDEPRGLAATTFHQ